MRADAARNREAVISAAASVLASSGLSASVSDIADRAGVAKGTVFRHFASKEDLVSAVVAGLVNELVDQAEGLLDATDPLQALREFVAAGIRLQARDQAFCQLASTAELAIPGLTERRTRLENVADLLARRAVEAGTVRADVTGREVVGMMTAAYQGACATGDPGRWPYFLSLLITGLRHAEDSSPSPPRQAVVTARA